MALCTQGYTMETKICRIKCSECPDYDSRSKKERQHDAYISSKNKWEEEKNSYDPGSCDNCKYYHIDSFGGYVGCKQQYDPHDLSSDDILYCKTDKELLKGCPLKMMQGKYKNEI